MCGAGYDKSQATRTLPLRLARQLTGERHNTLKQGHQAYRLYRHEKISSRSAMTKPRLHFHSDCDYFAGCERGMPLLWGGTLNESFQISFSYRASSRYTRELAPFVPSTLDVIPLNLGNRTGMNHGMRMTNAKDGTHVQASGRPSTVRQLVRYVRDFKELLCSTVKLVRLFRRLKVDVLHLNNGGFPGAVSVRAGAIAGRLARCPVIVMTVHNVAEPYDTLHRKMSRPIDILVTRSINVFTTASDHAAMSLENTLRLPPDRVVRIQNAVADPCTAQERDMVDSRNPVKECAGPFTLGVVGSLDERKGQGTFLQALGELQDRGALQSFTLRALLIGEGPAEQVLRDQATTLGIDHLVSFMGYRHDYLRLLEEMHILIVPSIANEDSPLISLEAMARGVPVIASRFAGLAEQLVDEQTGLLFTPGNSSELSHALARLMTDSALRSTLAEAGRRRQAEKFSTSVYRQQFLHLYERLQLANRVDALKAV